MRGTYDIPVALGSKQEFSLKATTNIKIGHKRYCTWYMVLAAILILIWISSRCLQPQAVLIVLLASAINSKDDPSSTAGSLQQVDLGCLLCLVDRHSHETINNDQIVTCRRSTAAASGVLGRPTMPVVVEKV